MGLYRSEISSEDFFKNYDITSVVLRENSFRYRILISQKGNNQTIAAVEMLFGRWKIVSDASKEYRDLFDALKDAVNIYICCSNEFLGLKK